MDPANVTITGTLTNTVRYNSANKRWEKYSGTAWVELIAAATDAFNMTVTGLKGGTLYGANALAAAATLTGGAGSSIDVPALKQAGSAVWTAATLTNLNQLTNGPAYLVASALSPYAPLAAPALTGVPTAPTAAVDTNTTQLATTAYVVGQAYLKAAAIGAYAPLASPSLTGIPIAPTAAVDTNTTQLATTAYVVGQGYLKAATAASTYLTAEADTLATVTGRGHTMTTDLNTSRALVASGGIAALVASSVAMDFGSGARLMGIGANASSWGTLNFAVLSADATLYATVATITNAGLYVTGTANATSFSGAGTGLTGTAASLSVGNAATVAGLTPSSLGNAGARIVSTDSSGYIYTNYLNSSDNSQTTGVSAIMIKAGDNFLRSGTAQAVATFLSGASMNIAGSSTSCSGNASNITSYTINQSVGTGNSPSFVDITITSDERVKKNWRPFDSDVLAKLANVKRGIYDRTDVELTQAGVSANSFQEVMPVGVTTSEDGLRHISQSATLALLAELASVVMAQGRKIAELEAA